QPLKTYVGELRDPREEYILTASQSMRMDIKKYNGRMQDMLEYRVEPMIARMAALGEDNLPMAHLKKAWAYLLQNQAHDSLCCANSEPSYREIYTRFEKTDDIAREIVTELEQRMLRRIKGLPEEAIVVFNPLTRERDEPMTFDVIVPPDTIYTQPHLFFEGDEIPVYIQRVRTDALLRFVPFSGWVGQIPVRIYTLTAGVGKIPAGGYKALKLTVSAPHARPVDGLVRGQDTLENSFLRVRVNADGTLDVVDKLRKHTYTGLHRFMDDGEAGCGFMHIAPVGDCLSVSTGQALDLRIIENNPLKGVLRMTQKMTVPKGLTPDMSARSAESAELTVQTDVILRQGGRLIEFETTIDNTARDHRLRVTFPTDTDATQGYAGQPFDVVHRPVQPENVNRLEEGEMEPPFGWQPMQDFCGIADGERGVTIAADGVLEYEILPMRNTVELTLIRATDRLHVGVLASGSKFKLPKAQLQGEQQYRYAFIPHGPSYEDALDLVERFRHPCYSVQKDFLEEESMPDYAPAQPDLGVIGGFIAVDGAAITSAIKPAQNGNGLILRVFNPLCRKIETRVSVLAPFVLEGARVVRLDETDQSALKVTENAVTISLAPKKIFSMRIQMKKEDEER
ncbi:MAG: glycoside hydrolase family 38 C-terminal domain-containing protein, partial [Clostridia bacterium]